MRNGWPCMLSTYTSCQVCREWEATALRVNKNVRVALIRIGVVLGKDGGALGMMWSSEWFLLHFRLAKSASQWCPYVLIILRIHVGNLFCCISPLNELKETTIISYRHPICHLINNPLKMLLHLFGWICFESQVSIFKIWCF